MGWPLPKLTEHPCESFVLVKEKQMATKNSGAGAKAAATKKANAAAAAAGTATASAPATPAAKKVAKSIPVKTAPAAKTAPAKKAPVKVTKPDTSAPAGEGEQASTEGEQIKSASMAPEFPQAGRKELSEVVYADLKEHGFAAPLKLVEQMVKSLEAGVITILGQGKELTLPGFGKFRLAEKAARTGRNPATGAAMELAARRETSFKVGKALKDAVAGVTSTETTAEEAAAE